MSLYSLYPLCANVYNATEKETGQFRLQIYTSVLMTKCSFLINLVSCPLITDGPPRDHIIQCQCRI